MTGFISAILGRLLAIWIAGLCAWLLVRFGIVIPDAAQSKLVESLVGFVIPILISLYSTFHKLIDAKLNPTDAAAPDVVESDKRSVRQRRASRSL